MVQLWYPAAATHGFLPASYMPAKTAAYVEHPAGLPAGTISRIVVHAAQGAPAAPGAHPVLLYSPGSGDMRSASTTLVENMASEGYVVVAIDHTHEANVVEFPGGQLVRGTFADTGPASNTRALTVRVADTRFVLDQLAALDRRGRSAGKLDLSRIGMFGHSIGGATAAAAMLADPRIRAGADMDGSLYGPVAHRGLTRPFMLITSSLPRLDFRYDPSMRPFYAHLRGPRAGLELAGSAHLTFTDVAVFKPQLPQSAAARIGQTGSIDPVAAEQTVTRYLAAFFDHYLSGQPEPLLAGTGGPALTIIGATHHGVHPAVTPATIWWRSRGALLALALVLAGSGLLGWAARPARAAGHKEAHVSGHS